MYDVAHTLSRLMYGQYREHPTMYTEWEGRGLYNYVPEDEEEVVDWRGVYVYNSLGGGDVRGVNGGVWSK